VSVVVARWAKTKRILANVDASLSMIRRQRLTAAHSLAKYSLILVVLVVAGWLYLHSISRPVDMSSPFDRFEIEPGTSVRAIAVRLHDQKIIRSPILFRAYVKLHDLSLQAGVYSLSPSQTVSEIAEVMTHGEEEAVKLTIPEGYRLEQIAEVAGIPVKEFMAAAKGMEGTLFPDTYYVKQDITKEELIELMHANYLKKVGELDLKTLTLASLIERETKHDGEKPIVAGIINKRLAEGWPLELDATIQYQLGKSGEWWPNTTLLDRKIKSPYNTYLSRGLPPGPICNPGLASIKAAKNPTDSPYWFYLHDRSGNIHYGTTLEEHNQNISKYIN
jgi:UPF0755 protein